MFRPRIFLLVITLALALAACAGEEPKMVASSPRGQQPIAAMPAEATVIYNAYIELDVGDVDDAADRAVQAAYDYGGYMVNLQSWQTDGRKYTTVTLAVPAPSFDRLRAVLLRLGSLASERVSGELIPYAYDGRANYSQITLSLRPTETLHIALPDIGWNPSATLKSAFGVFLAIFGFMVDVLIWALVVLGPFALLAWGVRAAVRRFGR